jgi:hypothetical protein
MRIISPTGKSLKFNNKSVKYFDYKPKFEKELYEFTILKDSESGTILGTVKATDELHSNIVYGIFDDTDTFIIDSSTGIITVNENHTVSSLSYNFRVSATNSYGTCYSDISVNTAESIYWQLEIKQITSNGDSYFQMSDFSFVNENQERLFNYELVTSRPTNGARSDQGPDKIIDNDMSTKWCFSFRSSYSTSNPAYIIFKTTGEGNIKQYRWRTSPDTATWGRMPITWTLKKSYTNLPYNDSGWILVDDQVNNTSINKVNNSFFYFNIPGD